jgi:acyl-CoA synthetase (NDP forming)
MTDEHRATRRSPSGRASTGAGTAPLAVPAPTLPAPRADIHRFLHPEGVAIVGGIDRSLDEAATRRRYDPLYGAGNWHLVSPKGGSIGTIPIHSSVAEVPGQLDLAVLSTPPEACIELVEDCGRRGIGFVIVFSSGFSEIGGEGRALERRLALAGRRAGVRLFGPNTNTNAFEPQPTIPGYRYGKIGLVTQSGHNGRPIVQGSVVGIAFSRQVPCGNEVDLDVCDFIEYFAGDSETAVIAGYIEGFRDVDRLRRALAAANAAGKPVVLLKIGSTSAGARMAASHTGHLTGADDVMDGLFRQYGVVRVRDLDELLETAALLAKLPRGTGGRVALYSISGGSGTLMAEQAELAGLTIPQLSAETQKRLHEILPSYLSVSNPVDNGGTFVMQHPAEVRQHVLDIVMDDPAVDVLVVGVTGAMGVLSDPLCEDLRDMAARGTRKPVVVTWNSPKIDERGYELLVESQLPMFRSFRNCFTALERAVRWDSERSARRERPTASSEMPERARSALENVKPGVLDATRTRELLAAFSVPWPQESTARTAADASIAAANIGFPVVMKLESPSFPHKSDVGLVRVGVRDAAEAEACFEELMRTARSLDPTAPVEGALVQQMVSDGVELIVGVTSDETLGHALLIGMGGIFTEIYSDTSVRPLPVDELDVLEMLRELRGFPLLEGARGRPPVDIGAVVEVALTTAALATALGDRLEELDLNPLLAMPDGAVAVDALVVLSDGTGDVETGA